jgi:predicted RNase H-like HicB family nuclease
VAHQLRLTVEYEDGQDGWIIAQVRELPAAMSQGRTREEARDNVLDALQELALSYLGADAPQATRRDSEPLDVIIR